MVVIDYYSRYYEYKIMKSTTAEKTVEALREIFARHGLPSTISSDNGPQFQSDIFRDFMETMGIVHHRVTPRWPQANGEVERQNRSLVKRMKIAQAEGKNWKNAILVYVAAYRGTLQATTGKSPAEVLFGRKIRTRIPEMLDSIKDLEIRDRDAEQKGKSKLYADLRRHAMSSDIQLGDSVLIKNEHVQNKLDTPFIPEPYEVIARKGSQVTVESPQGVRYDRNTSHVKKYNAPITSRRNIRDANGGYPVTTHRVCYSTPNTGAEATP
jgi:hypothetical protein